MARKRDGSEKGQHESQKSIAESENYIHEKNFISLKQQLSTMHLTLREIPGDGNCLFGALADQLDGNTKYHLKHRQAVVSYMRNHREDFEPFVEDDVPFERHLRNLAEAGTYGGNECIVAFARLHKVKVVIHQLNTPLWQIDGTDEKNPFQLHISYHNGDHYNSVRRIGDCSSIPPKIKLKVHESPSIPRPKKHHKDELDGYHYDSYMPYKNSLENEEDYEENLMERTGCNDIELIRKFLQANNWNIHDATDDLLNYILHERKGDTPLTTTGIWSPEGTGRRILGIDSPEEEESSRDQNSLPKAINNSSIEALQAKLKPNTHLSNSKRKTLKKQLRKQQAHERKRQKHKDPQDDHVNNLECDNFETIVVKDIACLNI